MSLLRRLFRRQLPNTCPASTIEDDFKKLVDTASRLIAIIEEKDLLITELQSRLSSTLEDKLSVALRLLKESGRGQEERLLSLAYQDVSTVVQWIVDNVRTERRN